MGHSKAKNRGKNIFSIPFACENIFSESFSKVNRNFEEEAKCTISVKKLVG